MSFIINVEHLSKRYQIGALRRGNSFRDIFDERLHRIFHKNGDEQTEKTKAIWALKDVSFDVRESEVLGIIGRNGAGKSTLLKILSRITEPTGGQIRLRGRIASLLEVGTGFSGELTGRENLFLNGAILGMRKQEIISKFDEIVAFAEIERFIDTPVKRYSSGMYMRLAFAIAAHLDPEILIIDEVLAVGDIQFQRKCISKMDQIGHSGRTVLFVSHSMGLIRQLCQRALLLEAGKLVIDDIVETTLSRYEELGLKTHVAGWVNTDGRDKDEAIHIEKISIEDREGTIRHSFLNSETLFIRFTVTINEPHPYLKVGFDLMRDGIPVFRSQQTDHPNVIDLMLPGMYQLVCIVPAHLLNAGEYTLTPLLSAHLIRSFMHTYEPVLRFEIAINAQLSEFYGILNRQNHPGTVFPSLEWTSEKIHNGRQAP